MHHICYIQRIQVWFVRRMWDVHTTRQISRSHPASDLPERRPSVPDEDPRGVGFPLRLRSGPSFEAPHAHAPSRPLPPSPSLLALWATSVRALRATRKGQQTLLAQVRQKSCDSGYGGLIGSHLAVDWTQSSNTRAAPRVSISQIGLADF